LSVFVGIDVVNVMAAYQPVVQACGSPHNRKSAHVESENKSDTGNNKNDRKNFKITRTIPENHNRKTQN